MHPGAISSPGTGDPLIDVAMAAVAGSLTSSDPWTRLANGIPALLAAAVSDLWAVIWASAHDTEVGQGFVEAFVLLLRQSGGSWVADPLLMTSTEDDLPEPRPKREWQEWGPVCWQSGAHWDQHGEQDVDHGDHHQSVPPLDTSLLAIAGVAAQDVVSVVADELGVTMDVDSETGVFFAVVETEPCDPELHAVYRDGSVEVI
jgi:hypothetical protein